MEEEEIVENVMAVVEAAAQKVPKKWANVRALHLKAVDSVALPIYQIVLELGTKIEVPVERLEGEVGSGEVIDAAEVETLGKKFEKKKTKALRYADAGDGARVTNEENSKRKRNKKEQIEDVVMQEEVQADMEKKRRKSVVIPVDEGPKVGNKGKEKGKCDLDNGMEGASIEIPKSKKGKIEEGKKKSMKGGGDDGIVLADERQEDKKVKKMSSTRV